MAADIPIDVVLRNLTGLSDVERKGCGGFKCTFRAKLDGVTVAVQVHDPGRVSPVRLDREIDAMLSVEAENVARLVKVTSFEEDGRVYPVFICEYVDGTTLADLIESGQRFTWDGVGRIALGITQGLVAIHSSQLIHRDIKPANVMIRSGSGSPVILDLGVAKHLDKETLTPTGLQPGTRVWMAPEQLRGEKFIDYRADLFALGLVLYFAAAGEYPFVGADLTEDILERDPTPLDERALGMRPGFSQLVSRLMSKKAYLRPRTAAAVLEELERISGGK